MDMAHKQETCAFINATVLDGSKDMQPQEGMTVVVKAGKIAQVAPHAEAEVPADARVVDLHGSYLMPGLINLHVHLISTGKPMSSSGAGNIMQKLDNPIGRAVLRYMIKKSAQQQLASGTTTVRGAGDPLAVDIAVRDAINAGKYLGPRIVAPGSGITVPNGHGAGMFAQIATTPEEAAAFARTFKQQGADTIKLFVTGGVFDATVAGEPGVLRMSPEIATAACAEAHKLGLSVMAHVESTEGVEVALKAGVDTIEHGAPMTPEIIELYKGAAGTQLNGRKPSLTCTISPALPFVLLDPKETHSSEIQKINGNLVCAGIILSARKALEEGVDVGLGTDSSCPFVTQYDMWRELAYFAKYVGVSNAFALHTATEVNARLIGLEEVTGAIREGLDADILVTDANPLEDLSALRHPRYVMTRGIMADGMQVKHMDDLDKTLDWIMEQPVESVPGI